MSIANEVRNYLKNKPYILEALEKNITNQSKLASLIQKDLKIENVYAIRAGLRRYSEELRKMKQRREERVLNVLRGSRITLLDNVALIVSNKDIPVKSNARISVEPYFIIVIGKEFLRDVLKKYEENIVKIYDKCTALLISAPEEIQTTPGVVAFETSILAEQNINVIEFFSCFSHTIIVVNRADALRSYEILSKLIG